MTMMESNSFGEILLPPHAALQDDHFPEQMTTPRLQVAAIKECGSCDADAFWGIERESL